jgi:serine/threonine protein kinase
LTSAPRISADRWRQIEDIFHAACECPEDHRAAFLEQACGSDAELQREVESLLTSSCRAELEKKDPLVGSSIEDAAAAYLQSQRNVEEPLPPILGGQCLDHYCIIRRLGTGGMGEIYLAEDIRLKRKVALKMLPPHLTSDKLAMQRFEHEAQLVSSLNHANLLTVFEFCHFQGRHVLVTELIEGETVRQMLGRGPLDVSKSIDIAIQAATALSAAHGSGVIHRDIKPENIMVRNDGCVKLLDFGIAKLAEGPGMLKTGTPAGDSTMPGVVLGTPRYMSPEQALGVKLDARTDLFSLGAVLYEMLTGKAPFGGNTQSDLIGDILSAEPVPISRQVHKVPKKLQLITTRLLEKERQRRYQSADSLIADLRQFATDRADLWMESAPRWVAISVFLLAVVALYFLLPKGPITSERMVSVPRALAVLPFHNLRPDPATDFLGFSLADEVIAKLGYVKSLTVRPSSAIARYRDGTTDLHEIAHQLRADMLVTGTYLRDGDDLRVTARLVAFHPEAVLWEDTLNLKYDKLLTLHDRVAQMVIQGLSLHLGTDEKSRLQTDQAVNSLAYEYYLRGIDLYSTSEFAAAIEMLEKSSLIDSNYAPTWAYLGRAYTTNASLQFGGRDQYRLAEAAYDKAISLNPVLPEPRIYMANLFTDTGRVEASVPLLRVALQSSPNNSEAHWELGYAYRYGGMLNESKKECELARHLDPEVKINSSAFNTYLYLLEYDKFLKSLPANDSPLLVFYHGLGSYYKHDNRTAQADFDRAFDLAPDLLPAQIGMALSDGLRHHEGEGLTRLRNTEARMNRRGVRDPEAMYKVAQAYALLGDGTSALRMLQRSTSGGFFCYTYISRDPLLSSIRGTSEFAQVLEQARQRAEQFAERFSH